MRVCIGIVSFFGQFQSARDLDQFMRDEIHARQYHHAWSSIYLIGGIGLKQIECRTDDCIRYRAPGQPTCLWCQKYLRKRERSEESTHEERIIGQMDDLSERAPKSSDHSLQGEPVSPGSRRSAPTAAVAAAEESGHDEDEEELRPRRRLPGGSLYDSADGDNDEQPAKKKPMKKSAAEQKGKERSKGERQASDQQKDGAQSQLHQRLRDGLRQLLQARAQLAASPNQRPPEFTHAKSNVDVAAEVKLAQSVCAAPSGATLPSQTVLEEQIVMRMDMLGTVSRATLPSRCITGWILKNMQHETSEEQPPRRGARSKFRGGFYAHVQRLHPWLKKPLVLNLIKFYSMCRIMPEVIYLQVGSWTDIVQSMRHNLMKTEIRTLIAEFAADSKAQEGSKHADAAHRKAQEGSKHAATKIAKPMMEDLFSDSDDDSDSDEINSGAAGDKDDSDGADIDAHADASAVGVVDNKPANASAADADAAGEENNGAGKENDATGEQNDASDEENDAVGEEANADADADASDAKVADVSSDSASSAMDVSDAGVTGAGAADEAEEIETDSTTNGADVTAVCADADARNEEAINRQYGALIAAAATSMETEQEEGTGRKIKRRKCKQ